MGWEGRDKIWDERGETRDGMRGERKEKRWEERDKRWDEREETRDGMRGERQEMGWEKRRETSDGMKREGVVYRRNTGWRIKKCWEDLN